MHTKGYFAQIQQSYINLHKSLHSMKNEKKPSTLSPIHSPTLKTIKKKKKKHSLFGLRNCLEIEYVSFLRENFFIFS